MAVVIGKPPNFAAILEAFPDAAKPGVLFAYGQDIYTDTQFIPTVLIAHESVHQRRQTEFTTPAAWWEMYIRDPEFRYREEVLAHAAEFRERIKGTPDRNRRAALLQHTAQRLVAALYNYRPSRRLPDGMRDLLDALEKV